MRSSLRTLFPSFSRSCNSYIELQRRPQTLRGPDKAMSTQSQVRGSVETHRRRDKYPRIPQEPLQTVQVRLFTFAALALMQRVICIATKRMASICPASQTAVGQSGKARLYHYFKEDTDEIRLALCMLAYRSPILLPDSLSVATRNAEALRPPPFRTPALIHAPFTGGQLPAPTRVRMTLTCVVNWNHFLFWTSCMARLLSNGNSDDGNDGRNSSNNNKPKSARNTLFSLDMLAHVTLI